MANLARLERLRADGLAVPRQADLLALVLGGCIGDDDPRGVGDDPPVLEAHDAIGSGCHVLVVGDHDDGRARLVTDLFEEVDDRGASGAIEVARWLVGQQQFGGVEQGSGDGGTLHLPAAHLAG